MRLIIASIFLISYYKFKGYKDYLSINLLLLIFFIGLVGNFIPFFLISWSEQYIQSNTAGLLLSVAPIFTLILSHYFTRDDKFSLRKFFSITIGLVGAIFIIGFDALTNISSNNFGNFLPKFAVIISALGYVISSILAYRIKTISAIALTTFVTICAAITSIPFMIFSEFYYPSSYNYNSLIALVYLGLFPTAIAFVLRFHIISKAGPIFLSYVAYLLPAFAIFWGYIILKETITSNTFIGVVLILIGVFFSKQTNVQNN